MDEETNAAFVAHVEALLALSLGGDAMATRSLACMALLVEGHRPGPPEGDGEPVQDERDNVIDFAPFLGRLAA